MVIPCGRLRTPVFVSWGATEAVPGRAKGFVVFRSAKERSGLCRRHPRPCRWIWRMKRRLTVPQSPPRLGGSLALPDALAPGWYRSARRALGLVMNRHPQCNRTLTRGGRCVLLRIVVFRSAKERSGLCRRHPRPCRWIWRMKRRLTVPQSPPRLGGSLALPDALAPGWYRSARRALGLVMNRHPQCNCTLTRGGRCVLLRSERRQRERHA
jgi:hypothetical protein